MKFMAGWRIRKPADDAETVYVSEKFGVRSLHIGSDTIQSSMRIARPNDLELSYTRSMMAFLLFNERPESALMVGLGGGSVAKFIYHRMPWVRTRVVEISPQVLQIARQCFRVPPDDDRFEVVIDDGAGYVAESEDDFDLLMVDGYDGESHVEELTTTRFYRDCRSRLVPGGVLVVNLWGGDRQFNDTLRRIESAFPDATLCLPADKPGNVIAFAFQDSPAPVRWSELEARAAALEPAYGLDFARFVAGLRKMNRHDAEFLYC